AGEPNPPRPAGRPGCARMPTAAPGPGGPSQRSARRPPTRRRLRSARALLPTARATPRTREFRGGRAPAAARSLRSVGAENGQGASAFHFHGAAGRPIIHLRASVQLGDGVVVARIATRSTSPYPGGLGAGTARHAG